MTSCIMTRAFYIFGKPLKLTSLPPKNLSDQNRENPQDPESEIHRTSLSQLHFVITLHKAPSERSARLLLCSIPQPTSLPVSSEF